MTKIIEMNNPAAMNKHGGIIIDLSIINNLLIFQIFF